MSDFWLKDYKQALTAKGRLMPRIEQRLMRNAMEKNSKRDREYLHPSQIAKKDWCPRSSWYELKGEPVPPESYGFSRLNVFAEGNAIHDKWQGWLRDEGILIGNWFCKACGTKWWDKSPKTCVSCDSQFVVYAEVPVEIPEYMIIGHADGEIEDSKGKALIEIKSVGLGTLRFDAPELLAPYNKGRISMDELWKSIRKPFGSHLRQINLYMLARGINDAVVIYEWKPTQQVKEFEIRYQETLIADILKGASSVKSALDGGSSPMRPVWATSPDERGCKKCPFRNKCWSIEDAESDQSGVLSGVGPSSAEVQNEVRPADETGGDSSEPPGLSRRVVRRGPDGLV